jgi:hypothetical protein
MDFQADEKETAEGGMLLPPLSFEPTLANDYSSALFLQKLRS